jgi:hypothetical protein
LAVLAVLASAAPRAAPPARAGDDLGLSVPPVEAVGGAVCVSYRVERPFTPRLEETLLRGMPATIRFEVGLWKRRALWFDKLILALKSEHKVVYDPWAKVFRIRSGEGASARTRSVASLDSLQASLFAERRLPLALAATLDSTGTYYVSVRVVIRPVSEEDLGEIEDWLAGEVEYPDGPSNGPSKGLPRYLFGIAAGLSGLGDRTAIMKSQRFTPARLALAPAIFP